MSRLTFYMIAVVSVFIIGFIVGWERKTERVNAATVKQVVKAEQTNTRNQLAVERQNERDKITIRELEDALIAARNDAAARSVPKPPGCRRVPAPQGDARPREDGSAERESARRYEEAYRSFRDELLSASAVAEQLRLQVLSCQAQWPQ